MTLAYERFAYLLVLVSFVASLCKSNSREFVESLQLFHEFLLCPDSGRVRELRNEDTNLLHFLLRVMFFYERARLSGTSVMGHELIGK